MLLIFGNSAHARIDLTKGPNESGMVNKFYNQQLKPLAGFNDVDLRKKLHHQKALKGFGIFNIAWGGVWVVSGTVLGIGNSDKKFIVPVLIRAGAATMGLFGYKKQKEK